MRTVFTLIIFFFSLISISQVDPVITGMLPALIDEASGLQCGSPDICWTFNDSEDGSRLYEISSGGLFSSQVIMQGASQMDYEDIARASDGRFFIGDFGNNNNDRDDLKIYITGDLDTSSSSSVSVETIEFTLADQSQFPPQDQNLNFDIEAMIHHEDSLYLFTRNRTEPYNGWTKFYKLPDSPGTYEAVLVDSIFGNLSSTFSSVTGADINPTTDRIALLTNGSLYILTGFEDGLDQADIDYNFFSFNSSFEGISFIDQCTVLLVEEGDPAMIYSINTCNIVSDLDEEADTGQFQIILRNRILTFLGIQGFPAIRILDSLGREVLSSQGSSELSLSTLTAGVYIVQVATSNSHSSMMFSLQ
ncbi:MAG: T9SS type A sorting domain-containing protein [Flavobacteriales bacterium]|nr:T9SS type A sorting domain-containing protein [Flavobacteriales bacterium]